MGENLSSPKCITISYDRPGDGIAYMRHTSCLYATITLWLTVVSVIKNKTRASVTL